MLWSLGLLQAARAQTRRSSAQRKLDVQALHSALNTETAGNYEKPGAIVAYGLSILAENSELT